MAVSAKEQRGDCLPALSAASATTRTVSVLRSVCPRYMAQQGCVSVGGTWVVCCFQGLGSVRYCGDNGAYTAVLSVLHFKCSLKKLTPSPSS